MQFKLSISLGFCKFCSAILEGYVSPQTPTEKSLPRNKSRAAYIKVECTYKESLVKKPLNS